MKTIAIVIVLFACATGHHAGAQENEARVNPVQMAETFVDQLANGDFAACVTRFDSTVGSLVPESKMKELWGGLQGQLGSFKGRLGSKSQTNNSYEIVLVTCRFERDTVDMKFVVNAEGKIAGLFFVPAKPPPPYQSPSYVRRRSFKEEEVTIGSGRWALPGTLTLPAGKGPFRGVVLVHGSGPNDRDETLGPNKPFRDLAWGLASQGIAVLRYEKRTREHAAELMPLVNRLTVKEETIDDAIAAFSLLRGTKGIDSTHVYVLGHSLGATLAPWIGRLDQRISGFILMAGAARHLEDIMVEQYSYIFSLDTGNTEGKRKQLDQMKRQTERIKSLKSSDSASSEMLLSAPAAYWLALQDYEPAVVAKTLPTPLLVLQGGRDYQVTMTEYDIWKGALEAKQGVRFTLYPRLNHLFMEGKGRSTPSEYDIPGHVAEYVLKDIAGWIKK